MPFPVAVELKTNDSVKLKPMKPVTRMHSSDELQENGFPPVAFTGGPPAKVVGPCLVTFAEGNMSVAFVPVPL